MELNLYSEVLKNTFLPYVKAIQDFQFLYDNPLFWAFFMALFLVLDFGLCWSRGKAFFFCVVIAGILLGATWMERAIISTFVRSGESFDPFVIRALSCIAIGAAVIYFFFVDNS